MTTSETSALLHAVKRSHWNPEIGMKMFLRRHPHLERTPEMYGLAICVGRTPFPNIVGLPEGPFPEDKSRPWHDARMWNHPDQQVWERDMAEMVSNEECFSVCKGYYGCVGSNDCDGANYHYGDRA